LGIFDPLLITQMQAVSKVLVATSFVPEIKASSGHYRRMVRVENMCIIRVEFCPYVSKDTS